ncbi:MAG: UvrD-helicase domain-containing protein [Candidatus Electrothrix sp. Rat3]|nr:UvrD-helicase domain-containing protein [Candidatus Electrothrix rattekaaiensis]
MHPLNPLTLTLHGQILIEASAGTGKTYTIALLFLRLLLEKGLSVDEILVVTFTKAATEELRGRIRQRIRDALDVLEGQGPDDPLLQELLNNAREEIAEERAKILLGDSLTRMDEAAIYTIHGFCQRMLQEHAFESGAPFAMEFLESEQLLRKRIMEDFWRQRFYPASEAEAAWVASLWQAPEELLAGLGGHLGRQDLECLPAISEEEVGGQGEAAASLFTDVQEQWQEQREEVAELLRENKRLSRDKSKGYGLPRLEAALELLDEVLAAQAVPWLLAAELELFTNSKIQSSLKKNKQEPPDHPFFALFEEFFQTHQRLSQSRRILVLVQARTWLHEELTRRKQAQDQLSFDDLLTQLEAALQGDEGGRLAGSIGRRFPVIMVDEFQDTDPLQYRIFAAVHRAADKDTKTEISTASPPESKKPGLFLIGDPKQAIYSFRGADIFTYIQARQDTLPENRLTMTTNYRSATPMVAAVNHLFHHEAPFLFAKDEIDFPEVEAAGLADKASLVLEDMGRGESPCSPLQGGQAQGPAPTSPGQTHRSAPTTSPVPLTCLLLPEGDKGKPLAKGTAEEQAARFCAHEIADLLAAGQQGKARIGDQPLSAGDFAVLVRTHAEADLVRKELSALSITSVSFSQQSVFSGKEARQLLTVMTALNDLSDSALVRTALVTELFGYTAERLDKLRNDEQEWEEVMFLLAAYRRTWQQQGVIPMLQKLLKDQQTVSRLHAAPSGERMLTNFLHLAELLQAESRYRFGVHGANALLRWFSDQIHSPEKHAENQQLRLESDENLVKIVTIHKSKGMEYPVVFLPFLWAARPCSPKRPLAFHRPEQPEQLCLDLGSGKEEHFLLAEKERLAEDLRLLYVAVTRARACCFFCWGRVSKMEDSALCYLLHGGLPAPDQLFNDLDRLDKGSGMLALKPFPDRFLPPKLSNTDSEAKLVSPAFKGQIDTRWRLTSYSGLIAALDSDATHDAVHGSIAQPERPDYDEGADRELAKESGLPEPPILDAFRFPKGAAAGTCLHAILEKISFTDSVGHEAVIGAELARAGFKEIWLPVVGSWIRDILNTGLKVKQDEEVSFLSAVRETDRVNEMAFYFPLAALRLNKFNRILQEFSYPPLPNQHEVLEGLMVGFIDLVFAVNGRYYLADYKSNYLGDSPADYQQEHLQAAMLDHRYDLQYLIYTLALHRFLKGRIRDYRYDQHFGGALYLFLRGMHPDNEAGTGVFAARPPLALIEALDRVVANVA